MSQNEKSCSCGGGNGGMASQKHKSKNCCGGKTYASSSNRNSGNNHKCEEGRGSGGGRAIGCGCLAAVHQTKPQKTGYKSDK